MKERYYARRCNVKGRKSRIILILDIIENCTILSYRKKRFATLRHIDKSCMTGGYRNEIVLVKRSMSQQVIVN